MSQAADMKHKQQVIKVQLSLLDEITEYINIPKMPLKIMHINTPLQIVSALPIR